ncbi:hypothetical protein [Mycoplasma phocoeninasale]|uniref:Lipoprotein n=1 Tax=Mycoplasma phocoeninasale TaxID=2726117 RepID=A0A858U5C2_9MOLU|nr:hypothetical protein [Mycoplasma phocoeninasale]MBN0970444.1 hypothetical protein [Mycoplasma phocoeninasale]QJG66433.1 hypothetical protein HGG64_01775 [Mycoplasma phocoeninasale]
MKKHKLKSKFIFAIGAAVALVPLAAVSCFKRLSPREQKIAEYKKRYIDKKNYVFDDFEDFTVNKEHILSPQVAIAHENFAKIYDDFIKWFDDFMGKFEIFTSVIYEYAPKDIHNFSTHTFYTKEVKINLNPRNYLDGKWNYSLFKDSDSYENWAANKEKFDDFISKIFQIPNLNIDLAVSGMNIYNVRHRYANDKENQDYGYFSKLTLTSDFWSNTYDTEKNEFIEEPWGASGLRALIWGTRYLKPKLNPEVEDNGFNADSHEIILKNGIEYEGSDSIWYPTFKKDYGNSAFFFKNLIVMRDDKPRLDITLFTDRPEELEKYTNYDFRLKTYLNKKLFSHFYIKNKEGEVKPIIEEILNPLRKVEEEQKEDNNKLFI